MNMLPYQFNYVEEHDISKKNILEKMVALANDSNWFTLAVVVIVIMLAIGLTLVIINSGTYTSKYILGIGVTAISVICLVIVMYMASEVKSVGYYEAEVKVTDIKKVDGVPYGVVEYKKGKATTNIKIADNQDVKKGDEVKVLTKKRAYKKSPIERTLYPVLIAQDQDILLKQ